MLEEYVVRDDKIRELEKLAILFSEYRKNAQKKKELTYFKKWNIIYITEPKGSMVCYFSLNLRFAIK